MLHILLFPCKIRTGSLLRHQEYRLESGSICNQNRLIFFFFFCSPKRQKRISFYCYIYHFSFTFSCLDIHGLSSWNAALFNELNNAWYCGLSSGEWISFDLLNLDLKIFCSFIQFKIVKRLKMTSSQQIIIKR